MMVINKNCKNCRFFRNSDDEKTEDEYNFCCRYPQHINKYFYDWCGEWKPKIKKCKRYLG